MLEDAHKRQFRHDVFCAGRSIASAAKAIGHLQRLDAAA
jgi:hypothetical protein